jgi:hypothetical protein
MEIILVYTGMQRLLQKTNQKTPLSNELLLLCFFLIESSLIASVVTMPESHEHTDVDLLYSSSKTAQPEMERAFLSFGSSLHSSFTFSISCTWLYPCWSSLNRSKETQNNSIVSPVQNDYQQSIHTSENSANSSEEYNSLETIVLHYCERVAVSSPVTSLLNCHLYILFDDCKYFRNWCWFETEMCFAEFGYTEKKKFEVRCSVLKITNRA